MRNLEREGDEGKTVQEYKPFNLVLKIYKGFTIDERDVTQPYAGPEYFRVMAWTRDEEYEYGTQAVRSFNGFHSFNQELVLPLDSPADQYLYMELLRGASWKDPGTCKGTVVMGRARIPLPPRTSSSEVTSKVELVGLNSDRCVVFKGYLDISMKLIM